MSHKARSKVPKKRPGFGSVFVRDFVQITHVAATASNAEKAIDLDLDFESNEVFDIYWMKTWFMVGEADLDVPDSIGDVITELHGLISEQPNFDREVQVTDAGDAVFEDDPSIVHYHPLILATSDTATPTEAGFVKLIDYKETNFGMAPYTVADNMTLSACQIGGTGSGEVYQLRSEIFGTRRRETSDKAFNAIINQYRR